MVNQYGLGIDLGTTQTAAAVRAEGRVEVVRLGARRPEIPSLVFVKPDGGLLIGDAAERRGLAEPARLAREFKRRMGDPVPILVGGSPFSAHALTGKLLRHVLDTVQQLQDGPPAAVTVTHPANWGPYKREQLDQAVRLADAGPVRLCTEPEAAALQHATARRIAPGEAVAVYDLGGGTFDAAVLRRDADGFALLGEPEGIEQLGGADFDEAVFGHVIGVLGARAENLDADDPEVVTALARLRRDCVEAKEALSFDTEVMIPVALPGLHTRVRLNRSELESMIAPSLEDTVDAMRRALRSAGVEPGDLDAVLLAGGSSRIPLVAQLLSTAFERPVVADPHPEHSIALGAAVSTAAVIGGVSPFAGAVGPAGNGSAADGSGGGGLAGAGPGGTGSAGSRPFGAGAGRAQPAGAGPAGTQPVGAGPGGAEPIGAGSGGAGPIGAGSGVARPGGAGSGAARAGEAAAIGAVGATAGVDDPDPTRVDTPVVPGLRPVAGGAAAQAGDALGAGPVVPADSRTPTPSDAEPTFSRGTASVPGAGTSGAGIPAGTTPAGSVAGASPPGSAGATPTPGVTPPPHAAGIAAPPPAGTGRASGFAGWAALVGKTSPPGGGAFGGRTHKLVMVAAVAVTVVAAGTATALAMSRDNDDPEQRPQAGGATSAPASSAPAAPPPPFPTDTILARNDQGTAFPARSFNIVSFTPGTAARTTVPGTDGHALPQWSTDRTRFATTRPVGDSAEIWVRDADGGNARKVIDNASGRVAWSPDDTKLAFMRSVDGVSQIFVVTVGKSDEKQLTWSRTPKDDPVWSPDGETIAYWRHVRNAPQLHLLSVDDPEEPGRRLTSGSSTGPAADPAWSPDGRTIAYTKITGTEKSDIWLVDADGDNARPLTEDAAREMDPNYSADGSWIVFMRGDLARPKVTIAKVDGSDERTLTEGNAREAHPAWS